MSTDTNEPDTTESQEQIDHYRIVIRRNPNYSPFIFTQLLSGGREGVWQCSIETQPTEILIDDTTGSRKVKISIDIQVSHDNIKDAVSDAIQAYDQAAVELRQPPILD